MANLDNVRDAWRRLYRWPARPTTPRLRLLTASWNDDVSVHTAPPLMVTTAEGARGVRRRRHRDDEPAPSSPSTLGRHRGVVDVAGPARSTQPRGSSRPAGSAATPAEPGTCGRRLCRRGAPVPRRRHPRAHRERLQPPGAARRPRRTLVVHVAHPGALPALVTRGRDAAARAGPFGDELPAQGAHRAGLGERATEEGPPQVAHDVDVQHLREQPDPPVTEVAADRFGHVDLRVRAHAPGARGGQVGLGERAELGIPEEVEGVGGRGGGRCRFRCCDGRWRGGRGRRRGGRPRSQHEDGDADPRRDQQRHDDDQRHQRPPAYRCG